MMELLSLPQVLAITLACWGVCSVIGHYLYADDYQPPPEIIAIPLGVVLILSATALVVRFLWWLWTL